MAAAQASTRLFVYGSLLRGESNHALLARSRSLGPARTEPAFELVLLDGYPAMVQGGTIAVTGELYSVTPAVLKRLDRLEDHPHLYRRVRIPLIDMEPADAYVITAAQAFAKPRIPSGDWRKSRGEPPEQASRRGARGAFRWSCHRNHLAPGHPVGFPSWRHRHCPG